jgi:ABC-type Fe3+/spermidine/putrescine transport system ATPase subunit
MPTSRDVCEFLGATNLIDGVVSNDGQIDTDLGKLTCPNTDTCSTNVSVAIRPEELLMSPTATGLGNEFAAEVLSSTFLGELTVCDLQINGKKLRFKTTQSAASARQVYIRLPAEKIKLFAK